jgi:hypothetical protein
MPGRTIRHSSDLEAAFASIIEPVQAVSVREVGALLDIAGEIEYDPMRGFAPEALIALCDLLGADWVTYCERAKGPMTGFTVHVEVGTRPYCRHTEELEAALSAHHHEYALGLAPATQDRVVLMSVCDHQARLAAYRHLQRVGSHGAHRRGSKSRPLAA